MASTQDSANADDLSTLWQECAADLTRLRADLQGEAQAREKAELELRCTRRELDALNAVTAVISGSLELAEVISMLKRQLTEQFNVPGGCVYLHHHDSGLLDLAASWGVPPELLARIKSVRLNSFHNQEIVLRRAAVVCADVRERGYFVESAADNSARRGDCGVALYADGAIQGVLELFGATAFSEDQVSFFTARGQQVGIALYHARLFEQLSEGRERLRALSQRLVAVQEEKRRHLARELHDEVGQLLTGLKLTLEMSARDAAETSSASLARKRRS